MLGDAEEGIKIRSVTLHECLYNNFLSQEEPMKVEDSLLDADQVLEM